MKATPPRGDGTPEVAVVLGGPQLVKLMGGEKLDSFFIIPPPDFSGTTLKQQEALVVGHCQGGVKIIPVPPRKKRTFFLFFSFFGEF